MSNDSCKVSFSKIGGMNGHDCAYDFHNANILNHMYGIEYI